MNITSKYKKRHTRTSKSTGKFNVFFSFLYGTKIWDVTIKLIQKIMTFVPNWRKKPSNVYIYGTKNVNFCHRFVSLCLKKNEKKTITHVH